MPHPNPNRPLNHRDYFAKKIGERIRRARKRKGITQEELADRAETSKRTIERIENDEKYYAQMKLMTLYKVSVVLNMSMDFILAIDPIVDDAELNARFVQLFQESSVNRRRAIMMLLDS